MALKTSVKPSADTGIDNPPALPVTSEQPPATVLLELALYKNYTWRGKSYVGGKAYKFLASHTAALLNERDHERPIWRMYRPKQAVQAPIDIIVDATGADLSAPDEPIHGLPETSKRIDIGSDEEITDILQNVEAEGNVTL